MIKTIKTAYRQMLECAKEYGRMRIQGFCIKVVDRNVHKKWATIFIVTLLRSGGQ